MMMSQTQYYAILFPIGILAAIGCALLWHSVFKDDK